MKVMNPLSTKEVLKEHIALKKEFVRDTLGLENKIFYVLLAFTTALVLFIFEHPERSNLWWVAIFLMAILMISEKIIEFYRVKKFNELMCEIENGKISSMQLRPQDYNRHGENIESKKTYLSKTQSFPKENHETLRLAIVALLIAIIFGLLQIFPEGKTFENVSLGAILKAISLSALPITLPFFGIYVLLIAHNMRYKKNKSLLKLQHLFYDLGVFLTIFMTFLVLLLMGSVYLLTTNPSFPMGIVVAAFWIYLALGAILMWTSFRGYLEIIK